MNDKLVLVTGGTRGIGRELVLAFCRAGYEVVFTFRDSSAQAEDLARELAAEGCRATGYRCDSADEAAVQAFAGVVLATHGVPYALVHNAGITRDAMLMRMSSQQWHDVIGTNLNSAYYLLRPFVQPMVEQGDGVILLMSSVAGLKGNPGQCNYAATKAALSGLTRSLALELGRFNMRVNAIAPGYIATEMVAQISDAERKSINAKVPLRRLGTVAEVAGMAKFMLSADGAYVTGQTFAVDGGLTT